MKARDYRRDDLSHRASHMVGLVPIACISASQHPNSRGFKRLRVASSASQLSISIQTDENFVTTCRCRQGVEPEKIAGEEP